MKLPLSDLLDRWSIELRKDYYGHGNKQTLEAIATDIREHLFVDGRTFSMLKAAVLLGLRNADIANLEWQIRTKQNLPLEEIGRRAVITRKLNDARCEAKQRLSEELGENVEQRHFGYGSLDSAKTTLDVQEPGGSWVTDDSVKS